MQFFKALPRKELDCFPDDQVGGSKVLEPLVRGSELVNGLVPLVKEYGAGDRAFAAARQDNKARSGLDDQIVDVKEK